MKPSHPILSELIAWPWLFIILAALAGLAAGYFWYRRRQRGVRPFQLAESKFLEVDGFQVHYIQEGSGPHLLLIHGIGASIYCWRQIFEGLTRDFTVTALDLPGFGRSSKWPSLHYGLDEQCGRITEFLDRLDIRQCRLVGCSMGGTLALWMALKSPKRFFEVAAIAPATNPRILPMDLQKLHWTAGLLRLGMNKRVVELVMRRVFAKPELI